MRMTSYKSAKAELVAIYRLEFYKKQKSWKLCHDVKRNDAKKPDKTKKLLNKTYVVSEPKTDAASELNDAFIAGSDSNVAKTPNSSTSRLSCRQSRTIPTRPVNPASPASETFELNKIEHDPHDLEDSPDIWPETVKPWDGQVSPVEDWRKNKVWSKGDQIWPQSPQNWPETVVWQDNELVWPGGEGFSEVLQRGKEPSIEGFWHGQSQVWTNAGPMQHVACNEEEPAVEAETEPPERWVPPEPRACYWHHGDAVAPQRLGWASSSEWGCCLGSRSRAGSYDDSEHSFMRAVHTAPHSSEIDLHTASCECNEQCLGSPEALSGEQLCACLRHHAAALRGLIAEARAREAGLRHRLTGSSTSSELYANPPNSPRSSCEERPTRDVGLRPPDVFLAGSHLNLHQDEQRARVLGRACSEADLDLATSRGRGRGRLHSKAIIAIGMGRPYRL